MQGILSTEAEQVWPTVRGWVLSTTVLTILALMTIHNVGNFAVLAFMSLAVAVYVKNSSESLDYQGIRNPLSQISFYLVFATSIFVASTVTRLTALVWASEGGVSLRTANKIIVGLLLGISAWRLAVKHLDLTEVNKLTQRTAVKKNL